MARIMIVSQWLLGHLIPVLGLGAELCSRGHSVTVVAPLHYQSVIKRAGLRFVEVRHGKYPQKFITETVLELQEVLSEETFELMICDSGLCAPAYLAEKRQIPWVSYMTGIFWPDELMPGVPRVHERMMRMFRSAADEARARIGLSPLQEKARTRGDLAGLSPYLHLMMIVRELIPVPNAMPDPSVFVGPCSLVATEEEVNNEGANKDTNNDTNKGSIHETWGEIRPSQEISHCPTIVVCTTSADRDGYREITERYVEEAIRVCEARTCQLIVSEDKPYGGEKVLPGHISWVEGVPSHDVLFRSADLIITHGGCGTLQKAIHHRVPIIVIPLGADHLSSAVRCQELGIGELLEPDSIEGGLEPLMDILLGNPEVKERMQKLSAKADCIQANRNGADEVERLLQQFYINGKR
ncbi:glycosyltransferase [Paenibacillus massiliensis]|uniref:glycosyltransferase n=1 Tax=Paenibacillus massiliensis TaxID=225917 RepID=UPI00047233FD|nr:glycosyltransferase [Paenibacillus massiliensis]